MASDTAIVVADGAAAIDVVTVLIAAGAFTIQVTIGAFGALAEFPVAAIVFIATVQGCGDEEQQKGQDPGQGAGIYDHSQGVLSSSFARSSGPRRGIAKSNVDIPASVAGSVGTSDGVTGLQSPSPCVLILPGAQATLQPRGRAQQRRQSEPQASQRHG